MSNASWFAAVRAGDTAAVREILAQGADVDAASEEQEWTALCFAAGRGDLPSIELLLSRGADPFRTGRDLRTPYRIALAAGHVAAARALAAAEERAGGDREAVSSRQAQRRPYCKAYRAEQLAPFLMLEREAVAFVHQDFSLTRSVWHGREVVLKGDEPGWRAFCSERLGFRVPDDFDFIVPHDVA